MAGKMMFQFHTRGIQEWAGRYGRIPGGLSVFKVVHSGGRQVVQAYIETSEGKIICESLQSQAVEKMIATINTVKTHHNRQLGGSFLLNEYGQVLVPTQTGQLFCVGQTTGIMLLRNLDTQEIVDLSDDTGLTTGDPWEMPYVGNVYRLSHRSYLYYWDRTTNRSIRPQFQDKDLIHKIRSVRRSGAVKLVVNPYGLVLAKVPKGAFDFDEDQWSPVYVGRINYSKWFEKEDARECRTGS